MIDYEIGIELHHRQFKGQKLSIEEQNMLNEWYAQEDAAEIQEITIKPIENNLEQLRIQISETLNQLAQLTSTIKQMVEDNDKIRKKNDHLFQLLIQKPDYKVA